MTVQRPTLPKAACPYPASIGILGEPVSKLEYTGRQNFADPFLSGISQHIRNIVDAVSRMSPNEVQDRIMTALSHTHSPEARGKAAWEVVAWHRFVRPYEHPDWKYSINLDRFLPIIEGNPDSYYLYALLVLKKPSDEVYRKMKGMNAVVAKQYREYCRSYAIIEQGVDLENLLFGW